MEINSPTVTSALLPESLFALLWRELLKGLGLLLSQEGFVVIVKVLAVVMLAAAEGEVVVDAVLFGGLAGGINHAEGKAHEEWSQLHPVGAGVRFGEEVKLRGGKGLMLVRRLKSDSNSD